MSDPISLTTAISAVSASVDLLKTFFGDTKKRIANIDNTLREISERTEIQLYKLDLINEKIDDSIACKLRASFCFLKDAAEALTESEQDDLLKFAYEGFTNLSFINPNGTTQVQNKILKNSLIASLGYLGRHLYFALRKRYKDSMLQVYECTYKFPEEGCSVFDQRFFSTNYFEKLKNYDNMILQHSSKAFEDEYKEILSNYGVAIVLDTGIEGLDVDEDGVILTFEREDLIEDLKKECEIMIHNLRKE